MCVYIYRYTDMYVCMHACMREYLCIYGIFEEESYFGNAFLRLSYCDITKRNLT